jgi:hypothetical protein
MASRGSTERHRVSTSPGLGEAVLAIGLLAVALERVRLLTRPAGPTAEQA